MLSLKDVIAPGTTVNGGHNEFFNGDEIHIQFELTCYPTDTFNFKTGYNFIIPKLELYDGNAFVSLSKLCVPTSQQQNWQIQDDYGKWQTTCVDLGYAWDTNISYADFNALGMGIGNTYHEIQPSQTTTSPHGDYQYIQAFSSSGTVSFPNTTTINALHYASLIIFPPLVPVSIVCGASFKFRDSSQQNQNGTYSGSGSGITATKVINDLRIRISNTNPKSTDNMYNYDTFNTPGSTNYPLAHQLWDINNLVIKKGFGVTAPHNEILAAAGQQPINYSGPDLYENFTAYQPPADFVQYIEYVAPVTEIKEVEAVPPFPVPAWSEVLHQSFDWTISTAYGAQGTALSHFSLQGAGGYGPSFGGVNVQGKKQASNPAIPPSNHVDTLYATPNNWTYSSWNGWQSATYVSGNFNSGAAGDSASTLGNPNYAASGIDESTNNITDDQYLFVSSDSNAQAGESALDLEFDITSDPWQQDAWYLVDLEFDDTWDDGGSFTPGLAGTDGDYGGCHVVQVGSQSGALVDPTGTMAILNAGTQIHPEGVGTYSGVANDNVGTPISPKHSHVHMQQVYRTEYGNADGSGDGRRVIRGIFQAASDSWRFDAANATTQDDKEFQLRFFGFNNTAKLETVIVKKLGYGLTEGVIGGNAFSWEHTTDILTHSFAKRKIYWKDSKLCWDVIQGDDYQWFQRFGNPSYQMSSYPPPHPGEYGWILKFTVGPNPFTGTFSGDGLRGYVNNNESDLGSLGTSYDGLIFSNIQDEGDYEIFFRTNGDETGWYINHSTDAGATWVDYSATGNIESTATMSGGAPPAGLANKIVFSAGDTTPVLSDLTCSISNISLKDQTLIFQGGSAGSWNFDGWDNSIAPYIIWNSNAGVNGLIEFNDCPLVDPLSGSILTTFINANQFVDRNIDRFEKFEIEFNHGLTEGMVKIYYFNIEGYGFRIPSIGPSTPSFYKHTVEVGDEVWNWENPESPNYAPELKETFVIQVDNTYMLANPLEEVNGWIDNIRMTRVYDIIEDENGDSMFDEKTVTFSEDVNGWTSFKSFIPESGLSLSKKYFTIDKGGLFQHYIPLKEYSPPDGSASYFVSSSVKNAENYNMFYGVHSGQGSSVRIILNNEPSTVKTFNTLNYEGTQAQILKPSANRITPNNAAAWSLGSNIQGWYCEDVKTNLDIGSVKEFIKKEGKWFNYIRGKNTLNEFTGNTELDTSLFSVQGIGESSSVTIIL